MWQQPWFLAGLFADVLAWVLTVVALRYLPVFAVQSILAGAIALTALAEHHGLAAVSSSADARIAACFEVTCMAGCFPP